MSTQNTTTVETGYESIPVDLLAELFVSKAVNGHRDEAGIVYQAICNYWYRQFPNHGHASELASESIRHARRVIKDRVDFTLAGSQFNQRARQR